MIGLELNFKNKSTRAILKEGVVSMVLNRIVSKDKNTIDLELFGFRPTENEKIKWLDLNLSEGDKIILEVKDISEASEPIEVKKINPENSILEGKLRAYNIIKKELSEEGLI